MASLSNTKIKDTYQSLVKFNDNGNITTSPKRLTDGFGNVSPFYVSTTQIGIGTSPNSSYDLHVYGNTKIGANLDVSGNLTVNGTLTYLNVTDLEVDDPLIQLAVNNTANILDIGLFGKYAISTNVKYKGLFNDASDNKFKLFTGLTTKPLTTVDTSDSGYTIGTLVANLEGNVTGTVSSLSNHTTSNLTEGTNLYYTNARADARVNLQTGVNLDLSNKDTDDLGEGSTNLYYTNARADERVDLQTGVNLDLSNKDTDDLSEGTTNLYFTTTRARASFTEGTGVTITDGEIAIGQDVSTTSNVTFGNISGSAISGTTGAFSSTLSANGGINGLTNANGGISGNNYDITGVNRLIINDPGEGIVFTGTTTLYLSVIDDTVDDKLKLTNATQLDLNSTAKITNLVDPTSAQDAATKKYVDDNSSSSQTLAQTLALGNTSGSNDLIIQDNDELVLGSSTDFRAYHNETNTLFRINTGDLIFNSFVDDGDIKFQLDNGADPSALTEYMRLDGGLVSTVFSKPTIYTNNTKANFGSSSLLSIDCDGTNGEILQNTGDLYITNSANDKSIIFRSDNGIGGVTEYFKIDGNINRNVISVTTQLNDNVPMIFGNGAGRPSIKYDSTASQLFINGATNLLSTVNFAGLITSTYTGTSAHVLQNSTSNGTVLQLNCTGDSSSLYLQGDHIYASGVLVIGNASSGANLYRGTKHDFESGNLRILTADGTEGGGLQIYSTTQHQYPQVYSDGNREAMWNYKNDNATWYIGLRTSTALIGANTGFVFYNTTAGDTVGGYTTSGDHYAKLSSRSPTFYDSNNTGYYVNPAGESRLHTLKIDNNTDSNNQLVFQNTSTVGYSAIRARYGTVEQNTIHIFGSTWSSSVFPGNSAGAINLSAFNGTTFGTWSSPGAWIYNNGQAQFNDSVRSPIFYDSDDTSYYLNPASDSNLNGLLVGGNRIFAQGLSPGSWYGDLGSNGYTREAGLSMTGGSEFVVLSKNGQGSVLVDGAYLAYESANGFFGSFNSTYGNLTGIQATAANTLTVKQLDGGSANLQVTGSLDINGTESDIAFVGGNMSFKDANSYIRITKTSASAQLGLFRAGDGGMYIGGSSSGFTLYTASFAVKMTIDQNGNSSFSGTGSFGGTVSGTKFIDSDNTGYYLDPAGTTNINTLTTGGVTTINNKLIIGNGQYIESANGNGKILLSGNLHIDSYNGNDIYLNYYSGRRFRVYNGTTERFRVDTNGITTAYYQMRSPVFYDEDNTSYYLNPASTTTSLSTAGKLVVQGGHSSARVHINYQHSATDISNSGALTSWVSEPGITYNSAGIGGNINVNGQYYGRAYDHGYGCYVRFDKNNGNVEHWSTTATAGNSGGQGTRRWYNDVSGNSYASSSSRAPTFYDSNDTAYYVNPNSKSNLYSIKLNGFLSGSSAGCAEIGRNHAYDTMELKGYGAEFMIGAQSNHLHINYRSCNNGASNHTPTNWFWRAGSSTSWSEHTFGVVNAAYSVKAPIFYDSVDTSYYVDPAGTSKLTDLLIQNGTSSNNKIDFTASDTSGYNALRFRYGTAEQNTIHLFGSTWSSNFEGGSRGAINLSGYTGVTFGAWNNLGAWIYNSGQAQFQNSVRSPIFYDSNNTNYYLDPQYTSVLNALTVGGNNVVGFSGSWMGAGFAGSRFGGYTVNGGELAFLRDNPVGGKVSVLVDGSFYAGENGGFYSLYSGNNYSNRRGFYANSSGICEFNASVKANGNITATSDVIAFSDKKLKTNIETLDGTKVLNMRGVSFNKIDTNKKGSGVIAQELQKVAPELVSDNDGTLGVAYGNLTGYLIEAIKNQQKQINELTNIIDKLNK